MKVRQVLVTTICIVAMVSFVGCHQEVKKNSVYKEDYQSTYKTGVTFWRHCQSDGQGQYFNHNGFLYYHNEKTGTFAPVCQKVNCLHDREPDQEKRRECNACLSDQLVYDKNGDVIFNDCEQIQYYDGYIYYAVGNCMYRVKKDGSKKDCVLKRPDRKEIESFLLHRGYLYYQIDCTTEDKKGTYDDCKIYKVEASSHMDEKDAQKMLDYEKSENEFISFLGFTAIDDYVFWSTNVMKKGTILEDDDYKTETHSDDFIYDTKTDEVKKINYPKKYSKPSIDIKSYVPTKKGLLISMSDASHEKSYKMPVFLMDYKTGKMKLWKKDVEQGRTLLCYKDYIISENVFMAYKKGKKYADCEIYDLSGKKLASYVCPTFGGWDIEGFGPDGVQVIPEYKKDTITFYEVKFQDVLKLHGEKVKLKKIGTAPYLEDEGGSWTAE